MVSETPLTIFDPEPSFWRYQKQPFLLLLPFFDFPLGENQVSWIYMHRPLKFWKIGDLVYSSLPNKRRGWNKRIERIFFRKRWSKGDLVGFFPPLFLMNPFFKYKLLKNYSSTTFKPQKLTFFVDILSLFDFVQWFNSIGWKFV